MGNIVINGVMGSIGNMLVQPLHYEVPTYVEEDVTHLMPHDHSDSTVILAQARFSVEELQVQGDIILFFNFGSFDMVIAAIDNVI